VPVTTPTQIVVTLQQRSATVQSDIGWDDIVRSDIGGSAVATFTVDQAGASQVQPDLVLWTGTLEFTDPPKLDQFRLLIEEREYVSADYTNVSGGGEAMPIFSQQPNRLIYAEVVPLDGSLLAPPPPPATGTESGDTGVGAGNGGAGTGEGTSSLSSMVNQLLANGVSADAMADLLAGLSAPAAPAQPLDGDLDVPSPPFTFDALQSGDSPSFSSMIASVVEALVAAGISAEAIVDVLAGLIPAATPAQQLEGDQDLPAEIGSFDQLQAGDAQTLDSLIAGIVDLLLAVGITPEVISDLLAGFVMPAASTQSLDGVQDIPASIFELDQLQMGQ
jgi:hypothetical protein